MSPKNLCVLSLALISLAGLPSLRADRVGLSVGVVIKAAPPQPRQEIIIARPSTRHVWVSGYWRWQTNRHVWIPGHWELPPRERVIYVPARWDHRDDGYVFVDGQWLDSTPNTAAPIPASTTSTEIIVSQAPPAPPPEAVGQQPFPNAVWIAGYWSWGNGAYVWNPGRWAEPPTPRSAFVAPHWEARDNGYAFCPGFWQDSGSQPSVSSQVFVTEPPPPPMHEVIVKRPSRHHVWIGGHWYWHGGRYVWAPGHWDLPPHRRAVYVAPHWENRGHGFVLIEGNWR
jgi:hypothetical protein